MVEGSTFTPLGPRFEEALVYAARVHALQCRKGTATPYVAHLLAVASIVAEGGGDEDEIIAALLHDAVEDQGGAPRLADIRARFGPRVAAIVEGCTAVEGPTWRATKEAYVARLAIADPAVLRVSSADKLHNARSILADLHRQGEVLWAIFGGGKAGTLWYYRALVEAYRARPDGPPIDELARVVAAIEALAAGEEAIGQR